MKVAIIGAGKLGTSIARLLSKTHDVVMCFSTNQNKLIETAAELGVGWATPKDAVQDARVAALTVPWSAIRTALAQAGQMDGKVLWDCTNPMNPDKTGLLVGTDCSAGETVAGIVPRALVVKAIPPFAELLEQPPEASGKMRSSVFICGDNAEAKTTVSALVSELGADPVDAGPLTSARFTEPLGMLLVRLAYAQGFGGRIGTALVRYC